jgi:hypothetical protein
MPIRETVQSIQVAIFLEITDFNQKWVFKDTYNCSMATNVTEYHFKILGQGTNHVYSTDTRKGTLTEPSL